MSGSQRPALQTSPVAQSALELQTGERLPPQPAARRTSGRKTKEKEGARNWVSCRSEEDENFLG
jgi:hypothetical protein